MILLFPISSIADTEINSEYLTHTLTFLPLKDVISTLRYHLKYYPSHVDIWHALGHAYRMHGNPEDAAEAYGCAIEMAARYHPIIHFEHSAMLLHRALLRFESGDKDGANDDIIQALFQDHTNPAALAIQQCGWQLTTPIAPYTRFIMTALAREMELRRVPCSPSDLLPHHQRMDAAIALWHLGSHFDAQCHLLALTEDVPHYAPAWHRLALIDMEMQQKANALVHITEALNRGGADHRAYHRGAALHYLHRGQMHEMLGERSLAIMDFTRASDIDTSFTEPKEALIQFNYGNC